MIPYPTIQRPKSQRAVPIGKIWRVRQDLRYLPPSLPVPIAANCCSYFRLTDILAATRRIAPKRRVGMGESVSRGIQPVRKKGGPSSEDPDFLIRGDLGKSPSSRQTGSCLLVSQLSLSRHRVPPPPSMLFSHHNEIPSMLTVPAAL